jgi:hypothetical protein
VSAQNAIEFVKQEIEGEWDRLLQELTQFSSEEFTWQPTARFHSISWHVRHVVEWRYALIHVWICRQRVDEAMYCLGWEGEPIVQAISRNRGWYEPSFSIRDDLRLFERVRTVTRQDLEAMDARRYQERIAFPWRINNVLGEISQDLRHSALHRGQIRQIRTMYTQRDCFTTASTAIRPRSLTSSGHLGQDHQNDGWPFQLESIETQ